METLRYTIDFFEQHNLRYFAYGGTCLGAVRHHNMIPWDDDVDLIMPYEDYKRFIALKPEIDSTGNYKLLTPDTPGHIDPICRITNTDTTFWKYYLNNYILGTQIDVFPLYETDIDDDKVLTELLHKNFEVTWRYQRANQQYRPIRFWENIQHHHLRGLLNNIKWALSTKHVDKYKKEYDDFEATLQVEGGHRLVSLGSYVYGLEVFKKEWFADYAEMPFDDFKIRVPIGYDGYLSCVFGDYMQLPPKEKQQPSHDCYYLNLKEGLSIDEARKRLRKGEKYVY